MKVKFTSQIEQNADKLADGSFDDRVIYSTFVDDELIAQTIYRLGKFTVELASDTHALDISNVLHIASLAHARFDAAGTWSDLEFELAD